MRSDIDLTGWGLCQIDQGSHDITTAILWDWIENLSSGMTYYNNQRDGARNRLTNIGHLDTPAGNQPQQSMVDSEGYARYNDGPDGQFWEWIGLTQNNQDENGRWIQNATHLVRDCDENGNERWVRESADVLKGNVRRYLRYYD